VPVPDPEYAAAKKLWAEALRIARKLRLADVRDGNPVYVLRDHGSRIRKDGTRRGTPAPQELVDRMNDLNRRGDAARDSWRKNRDLVTRDLLHTLGGPVAESLFFGTPFEEPRERPLTKAQLRAMGVPETEYGQRCRRVGMTGSRNDFRQIRGALVRLGYVDVKEAREFYRHKVEKLVRQHAAAIKRVAAALMQHRTLSGAEVKRLIQNKQRRQPIERGGRTNDHNKPGATHERQTRTIHAGTAQKTLEPSSPSRG
jgi:hypothetical protein